MNWFDVAFLIVLAVFMIIGAVKGFVDQLFGLLGVFVAIYLSTSLCGSVAKIFPDDSGAIYTKIEQIADEKLGGSEYYDMPVNWSDVEENKEKTNEVINQLGVPGFIVELGLFNGIFKNFPEGETTLREVLPQQLTQTVNNVLVFIVLFILIMIVIAILKAILKKVAKIAGLNTINRLLGMAMGGIKITAIVVCVLAVLTIVGSFVGFIGNFVSNAVFTESAIGSSILKPIVEWVLTKISVG